MEIKILEDKTIIKYIQEADKVLSEMKFTEHNLAHVTKVAQLSSYILSELGYSEYDVNLVKIASYLHDIGNIINRNGHPHYSALLVHDLLLSRDFTLEEVFKIMSAVGNHDETSGKPVSPLSAALIIADKSDVRRSRVRKLDTNKFDIHDRVNYSVDKSELIISKDEKTILLKLNLNTKYSSIMEYLTIFSDRMKFCEEAAEYLGMKFGLQINDITLFGGNTWETA